MKIDSWKADRIRKMADEMKKPVDLEELARISGEDIDDIEEILSNHSAVQLTHEHLK